MHPIQKIKQIANIVKVFLFNYWKVVIILGFLIIGIIITLIYNNPYSVVVLCYLVFSLFVGIVFFTLTSNFRLKHKTARNIEIFGYILLFITISAQLFLDEDLLSESRIFNIESKLDYIFHYLSALSEDEERRIISDYGNTYRSALARGFLQDQVKFSNAIASVLKLISTVCIAIGRFDDINNKGEKNEKTKNGES